MMMVEETTTMVVKKTTLDRLNRTGYAGESKDELLNKLLDFFEKRKK
jgi:hypothetical protein